MKEQDRKDLYKFMGTTTEAIKGIHIDIKDIKDNHLHHVNLKINGLLFSVLGSVFVAILVVAYKFLVK